MVATSNPTRHDDIYGLWPYCFMLCFWSCHWVFNGSGRTSGGFDNLHERHDWMGSDQKAYDKKTSLPFGPTWCGMCSRHSHHLLVQSLTCALLTLSHRIFSWWTPSFGYRKVPILGVLGKKSNFWRVKLHRWGRENAGHVEDSGTNEEIHLRWVAELKGLQLKGQLEAWGLPENLWFHQGLTLGMRQPSLPRGCLARHEKGDLGLQDGAP